LRQIAEDTAGLRIKSWWDFDQVNVLRTAYCGDWEGMHATPSKIAITEALHRVVPPGEAETPPVKLSADFIKAHAGDRHGPAYEHRHQFPDGRVGSHSALARPEHGRALLEAATHSVAKDYLAFINA
jgi:creatinine amidohydrolase